MSKRTVEIDDTLQERVDSAIEDVKQELLNYLESNPDTDKVPDMGNDLDYFGALHEIIDGSVPIYTKEIDDTFYLYGNKIEEAFEDAGIGEKEDKGWPSDWKAAAIYCYIEQKVNEWYSNEAEDVFNEWKEPRDKALNEGTEAGESDAEKFNDDSATWESTDNPYGADTQAALHEIWQEAYDDAFEANKIGE